MILPSWPDTAGTRIHRFAVEGKRSAQETAGRSVSIRGHAGIARLVRSKAEVEAQSSASQSLTTGLSRTHAGCGERDDVRAGFGEGGYPRSAKCDMLMDSCFHLAVTCALHPEQPCTRGALAAMAHFLVRPYSSRLDNTWRITHTYDDMRRRLRECYAAAKVTSLPS